MWIPLILFIMSSIRSDPMVRRRSRRLLDLQCDREEGSSLGDAKLEPTAKPPKLNQDGTTKKKRKAITENTTKVASAKKQRRLDRSDENGAPSARSASIIDKNLVVTLSLPRHREAQVLEEMQQQQQQEQQQHDASSSQPPPRNIHYVIGIDEAGRGPLAGPVVAAAIYLPDDIPGIIDSKKISKEDVREQLFETIVNSPSAVWAVAVVNAATIDQINILQAALLGMRVAAAATIPDQPVEEWPVRYHQYHHQVTANNSSVLPMATDNDTSAVPTTKETGCYIVRSQRQLPVTSALHVHALIDGNRLPSDMDFCSKECLVKGDGREYAIAAASILAKVTRDRIMREYSRQYPLYRFEQHKGYGTVAHMQAIAEHGATPIHRLTFAPLKHMKNLTIGKVTAEEKAASP